MNIAVSRRKGSVYILIFGIGTDIVEIDRIKEVLEKNPKILDKIFSKNEIEYLKSRKMRPEYVAGRFAAKEAVSKAMGTGFSGFDIKEIVIESTASGKPIVLLKGKAKLLAQKNGEYKMHVSISHGRDSAVAYALMEVENVEHSSSKGNE